MNTLRNTDGRMKMHNRKLLRLLIVALVCLAGGFFGAMNLPQAVQGQPPQSEGQVSQGPFAHLQGEGTLEEA